LVAVFVFSISIFGQRNPAQTDVDSMCNVSANIIDKDPKGLNVRSKSSGKSKVIGQIPFNRDGTIVDIIGSKGNWLKIEAARNADKKVFAGTGWVYAPLISISTKRQDGQDNLINAYEMPSKGNDVIARLSVATRYRLAGCFEDWVKISIPKKSGKILGWLAPENQCDLPWTTCS
jgi:SH3-like domain-containing protein